MNSLAWVGRRIAVGIAATGAMVALGSAPLPAFAQDQLTIGALYLDAQGFYGGIKKGIEAGAADQNIRLLGQNSQGDASLESQFASTLVSSGVKAIIMSPVSATASVAVVRQAHDANIPVVCYNTCINDTDAKALVYALVTTDQYKLGFDAGSAAVDYFKKKGITAPRFGVLGCDVYEACRQRKSGFKDAVSKGVPGAVWAADQDGYEAGKATTTATNMLTGDTAIDAVFANNENGVIAAMQGVATTGRTGKVAVFGNDIDPQIAQYLLTQPDTLIATNGQQPQQMGKVAVQMALKAIKGDKNDTYLTNVPTELFLSSDPDQINTWLKAHADGIP